MPLYEYVCKSCETRFELLRPASRMDDPADCPRDHGEGRRVLSAFATVSGEAYGADQSGGGGGSGCGGGCSGCNCSAN